MTHSWGVREGLLQEMTFRGCMGERVRDVEKDQLHNWQGPVQSENARPLFQNVLSLSGQ